MSQTELGIFLKARRGQVAPSEVGLIAQGGRRVSGLRREEVAMLAGVSVDYLSRLEQGREKNPSPSVLNAIARALNLDEDLFGHLFRLADLAPTFPEPLAESVSPSLAELLNAWPQTPALVINRQLDILAANDLGAALYSGFAVAENLVRMTFIDTVGREFFTDWSRAAETCVAHLRLALGHASTNKPVLALVAELHDSSAEFQVLWGRHDVRGKTREAKAFRHPSVGDLLLEYNAFDVRGAPGQQLVVYRAEVGSPSSDKLRLLGTLAATERNAARLIDPSR